MAAPTIFAPSARASTYLKRSLVVLLAVLVIASFAGLAELYFIARSALPQLDGTLSVRGLSASVMVVRDGQGVPTIDAANLQDLFFAQGYVTAQDRLWQMDMLRRFAAGDLAELLGDKLIDHDREQRILGLRVAARKAVDVASPENRLYFDAYARGVNAFIDSHRDRLPIEFRILRYAPRPWTPEDSMLIAAQMVKDLNHGPYKNALQRERILGKLGPELTADLYVNTSWYDRPPTVARPQIEEDPSHGSSRALLELGTIPYRSPAYRHPNQISEPVAVGSNNWVVSGAHTVSGKPLLCDDMHLGHQMPNLWYQAHLRDNHFDVAGMTLPGMPYVIVGHNQRIAWGFTNIEPTVEDVFIETFRQNGTYLTPEGWKEPERRHEIIHVKGRPDVEFDAKLTRHGPLITELVPGETRSLALRWTLYDGVHNPFLKLNSAQNWADFEQALRDFDAPGQNVVYADVDGNLGYQATGKFPIRAAGDGSVPVDGSDNAHEWTAYIPFEELPSIFNPPWGIIATANARMTPDGYPHSISVRWASPWRTNRIYRVLQGGRKLSAADMLALQNDVYSEGERYFAERFVYAVDHTPKASARARQAADIMREWDGRVTAASAAAAIDSGARTELFRLLLEPKLGPAGADSHLEEGGLSWQSYSSGMQSIWLQNVIERQPKRWLPERYSSYDELLTSAVESALNTEELPTDLHSWRWGKLNAVEIQHPILGEIPLLRRWSGPGVREQSGSGYTVKAVTRRHGPSERMTVDLSDLDHSTWNLVTGEAGNFLSPHYMDQWSAWYEGHTFPFPFSKQAVEKTKQHQLVLEP